VNPSAAFSSLGPARFRHHPGRSTLSREADEGVGVDWCAEPAVVGYRRLVHRKASGEEIPVPICATPAIIGSAGIILAGYDGVVRFWDPSLIKEYWSTRLGAAIYAPLVVDPTGPGVVVGCIDGSVARLGLKGAVEWRVPLGDLPIYPAPLVLAAARLLVVATFHGRCFGLDLNNGSIRFDLKLPRPWHAAKDGLASWRDPYASPVAITDETFVQCCAESALLIDARGTVLWERAIGAPVRASPVFIPGTDEVLVVSAKGDCRFIVIESGSVRSGPTLGGRVVASPGVSGGVAAIGTIAGDIFGVDVESGSIVWCKAGFTPSDHSSIAVLPSGDFVVVTERGNAAALRASDGRFLWESDQRLGLGDQDPKMDLTPIAAPDGHLYCASYSGNVYSFVFPEMSSPSPCAPEIGDTDGAP
jgi:outer membrane protein assembly factor BamB